MPTIEFVSVDCPGVPDLPTYPSFAYLAESELQSHRALFQPEFDKLTGVIVHLANKECESSEDGGWFAGMVMEWDDHADDGNDPVVFKPPARVDVEDLLLRLLDASPSNHVTFSTDYQFGGEARCHGPTPVAEFLRRLDSGALLYNQLWHLTRGP